MAYQTATVLAYEDLQQVAGGRQEQGLYWTLFQSGTAIVNSNSASMSMDGKWDI
ncbi:hypothetical protein NKV53_10740 [Legionella sp. 27cVA30]|uniref:hypothetical protein n=1 Tax=Legionella sp. 27cVA30 TaxID=2905657 RepID=UPI0020A14A28|nr:hypothetical protein [Legionella sp. 27cVA30]MCP0914801.1 hypothetical protein [Legionella sp. 27cVA30]